MFLCCSMMSNKTSCVRMTEVTAGAEKNGMIVIRNGLQSDEHIATNGAYKLQEDMLTYLKPATTTGSITLPP